MGQAEIPQTARLLSNSMDKNKENGFILQQRTMEAVQSSLHPWQPTRARRGRPTNGEEENDRILKAASVWRQGHQPEKEGNLLEWN